MSHQRNILCPSVLNQEGKKTRKYIVLVSSLHQLDTKHRPAADLPSDALLVLLHHEHSASTSILVSLHALLLL
jgi:hypothetical protein